MCAVLAVIAVAECKAQKIIVNGGNQTLTITTAVPGSQPTSVVNTSCTLTYKKQSVVSRITVAANCTGQRFNLSVVATNVTKGTAAPAVNLVSGAPAANLITAIPRTGANTGSCTLQFTASSTFSQGNSSDLGNDVYAITYTIQQ